MRKFLIVNECGSDNVGDHAINEGLRNLLSGNGHKSDSVTFATTSSFVKNTHKVNRGFLFKLKKIILKSKIIFDLNWVLKNKSRINKSLNSDYDAILIGGGQLVLSGLAFPIAMSTWVNLANKKNIPVFIVGVGCGESFTNREVRLYKKAFLLCTQVFTREKASVNKMKSFFDVDAQLIPDLAFGLEPVTKNKNKARKGIAVGVTDYTVYVRYKEESDEGEYSTYESYIKAWYERLVNIIENESEEIKLVSTTYSDSLCNLELYKMLRSSISNPILLIDGVKPLNDYREILSESRLVLSGRMHSLILGKIEGCELVPWVISAKLQGFVDMYNGNSLEQLKPQYAELINALKLSNV